MQYRPFKLQDVSDELLTKKLKELLIIDCILFCVLAAFLLTLMFSRYYLFHFNQVTLNQYVNGSSDFTTNAASLVRSLGAIAVLSLVFGVTTGAAFGLAYSPHKDTHDSAGLGGYEEAMTKLGFVVINKTDQGTTYTLTDHGRRFLRDYRFLEITEETPV